MPAFRRAGQQAGAAAGRSQVPVRRRDQDDPAGQGLAIGPGGGRQRARDKISGSTVGPRAGICRTMRTGAGKSSGSLDTNVRSAVTPPADAATATTVAGGRAAG